MYVNYNGVFVFNLIIKLFSTASFLLASGKMSKFFFRPPFHNLTALFPDQKYSGFPLQK